MIHYFPEDILFEGPNEFTDPFRYFPHPLVRKAAGMVVERIDSDPKLSQAFSEGKMLGVLVCEGNCYIAGFSGNVGGHSIIEGFVPPIFDLLDPKGHFKEEEANISSINTRISNLYKSTEYTSLKEQLTVHHEARDRDIEAWTQRMQKAKNDRAERRSATEDASELAAIIKESQFEKAELRRIKTRWAERINDIQNQLNAIESEIKDLKFRRAEMSDKLQEWIFQQYRVHNALGEESTIADIFSSQDLIPPGGTGECAAPKLLEFAYKNRLIPLAMGEFWYGKSPETAVRTQGHFYPSCTSKCGPLLGYMLQGLNIAEDKTATVLPVIIHEDDCLIIVEKPGGMPSVPGLDGRKSLLEWLNSLYGEEVYSVHRLDMDTSGVMVFARTHTSAVELRRQFEEHSVRKTYMARLSPPDPSSHSAANKASKLKKGMHGCINLPLSADYDERPRQKVDLMQGKPAFTEYEVIYENPDGTTEILFHPVTGRTHQLRVHSAHISGLGRPIVGDLLYGGDESHHLHLHAFSIEFKHPVTGEIVQYSGRSKKL